MKLQIMIPGESHNHHAMYYSEGALYFHESRGTGFQVTGQKKAIHVKKLILNTVSLMYSVVTIKPLCNHTSQGSVLSSNSLVFSKEEILISFSQG